MQQRKGHSRQQQKKRQVEHRKDSQEAPGVSVLGMGIELEAYQACETCDRGAETADIHPEQKTGRILGKTGEQQCGRDTIRLTCGDGVSLGEMEG
jgi:hypothetical protein